MTPSARRSKEARTETHARAVVQATAEARALFIGMGMTCGNCGATIEAVLNGVTVTGLADEPCKTGCASNTRTSKIPPDGAVRQRNAMTRFVRGEADWMGAAPEGRQR